MLEEIIPNPDYFLRNEAQYWCGSYTQEALAPILDKIEVTRGKEVADKLRQFTDEEYARQEEMRVRFRWPSKKA